MKTCTACGLPAPAATLACALCARPFRDQGPTSYRLEAHGDGYRWSQDGAAVLAAHGHEGRWEVVHAGTGKPAVTVVTGTDEGHPRIGLVDHVGRAVATFAPSPPGGGELGLVRDGHDRALMAVRSDGPTGLHVIDLDGRVLALASRHSARRGAGLDVLLTRAGGGHTDSMVLGISLVLELLGAGQPVSSQPLP